MTIVDQMVTVAVCDWCGALCPLPCLPPVQAGTWHSNVTGDWCSQQCEVAAAVDAALAAKKAATEKELHDQLRAAHRRGHWPRHHRPAAG